MIDRRDVERVAEALAIAGLISQQQSADFKAAYEQVRKAGTERWRAQSRRERFLRSPAFPMVMVIVLALVIVLASIVQKAIGG